MVKLLFVKIKGCPWGQPPPRKARTPSVSLLLSPRDGLHSELVCGRLSDRRSPRPLQPWAPRGLPFLGRAWWLDVKAASERPGVGAGVGGRRGKNLGRSCVSLEQQSGRAVLTPS